MNKRVKRFYLMPKVWRTVTNSQVFNWVKIINEHGISSDCISISKQVLDKDSVNEIEKLINGKFYQHNIFSPLLNDVYLFSVLLSYYIKCSSHYDTIIFQTRLPYIGIPLYLIKQLPKSRIIFESRGATMEERKYENNGDSINFKNSLKAKLFDFSEKLLIRKSNKVICVSNALRDYYIKGLQIKDKSKFFITPGAADNYLFHYDDKIRNKYRNMLNFKEDDIVIVYSGALNMKWEIPNDVFKFLSELGKRASGYKFLMVTPDIELARDYATKFQLIDKTILVHSTFEEVNNYLNAADIALLLREDILMNNVASPTKFSEYLLAGLPTIISKGIYDFAEVIEKTNFGVVLQDNHNITESDFEKIDDLIKIDRIEISKWGSQNLSKEKFITDYIHLLENI